MLKKGKENEVSSDAVSGNGKRSAEHFAFLEINSPQQPRRRNDKNASHGRPPLSPVSDAAVPDKW